MRHTGNFKTINSTYTYVATGVGDIIAVF